MKSACAHHYRAYLTLSQNNTASLSYLSRNLDPRSDEGQALSQNIAGAMFEALVGLEKLLGNPNYLRYKSSLYWRWHNAMVPESACFAEKGVYESRHSSPVSNDGPLKKENQKKTHVKMLGTINHRGGSHLT